LYHVSNFLQDVKIKNYMERERLWIQKVPPKELLYSFLREGAFTPLLSQILINKGFTDVGRAYSFLFPQITDFGNPFEIPEMAEAVERIARALERKENIGIYGDSDADGIIGTFILYDFLKEVSGKEPFVLLPDKNKEGYGFHEKYLPLFKEKGVRLIITVDVGVSSWQTVEAAKALGLEVIVTDHHEILRRPSCILVSGKSCAKDSPFYYLCGAGVVFALVRALRSYLIEKGALKNGKIPNLRKYLSLLLLATLADMVPLFGENRLITYFGFRDLEDPPFLPLKLLFTELNLKLPPSEEDLHFKIIPRINVCGRMGKPELFFNFLKSETSEEARRYLEEINSLLLERQNLEGELWERVEGLLKKDLSSPLLIGILEEVPKGLLGLLANRARNRFGKPVLLITLEKGIGYGSGRSTEELDLLDYLLEERGLFLELGGHKKAFGFQILEENLPYLKEKLLKKLEPLLKEKRLLYSYVDGEASLSEILLEENYLAFKELPPYGIAHEPPFLLIKNFEVKEINILKEKHTKLLLKEGEREVYALYFNQILSEPVRFLIGSPYINNFSKKLEIRIEDAKP